MKETIEWRWQLIYSFMHVIIQEMFNDCLLWARQSTIWFGHKVKKKGCGLVSHGTYSLLKEADNSWESWCWRKSFKGMWPWAELMKSNSSLFFLMVHYFMSCLRNICLAQGGKDFLLCCLQKKIITLAFGLRSIIHFK